jgi:GNAT superfamily N-acetyltransferase
MTMDVRPAVVDDAGAIASIQVRGWRAAYRGIVADDFLDAMSIDERATRWQGIVDGTTSDAAADGAPVRSRTLVAEADGSVVGFASRGPDRDELGTSVGEVWAIYVDPDRWRGGAGRLLLDASATHLRSEGYDRAVLWVLEHNAPARAFYEQCGWVFDGSQRNFPLGGRDVSEVRYETRLA